MMPNPIDRIREQTKYFLTIDLAAKVRWRMRFERDPKFILLQDKIAVRDYAAERGVRTAPLHHLTDDPRTIPFSELPPDYMIKATHGSGWNIICRDSRHYLFGNGCDLVESLDLQCPTASWSGPSLSRDEVIEVCQGWLDSVFNPPEWAYRHIPPRIVVEPLLKPRRGSELFDYRFYTFNGDVKAINVDSPRYLRDKLEAVFDVEWNLVELSRLDEKLPPDLPERPETLDEMIAAAGRLGVGVNFARIDLYDEADGVVLGEITIYPQAGSPGTPTLCPQFNRRLGEQWPMARTQRCQVAAWNVVAFVRRVINHVRIQRTTVTLCSVRRRPRWLASVPVMRGITWFLGVFALSAGAAGKDRSTPWRSGDGLWNIALRLLLPEEHSCADVIRSPQR